MKILLINPFSSNWVEGKRDDTETAVSLAPIGILSVAAYLIKKGFDTEVYNCRGNIKAGTEALISKVISFKPDIVGFTSTTSSFLNAYNLVTEIKKTLPDVKVVFGGVHVSALKEQALKDFELIDYVVAGEGELAMAELAEGKEPSMIQGLVSRNSQGPHFTGLRTDLCELDELPFPAYDKLDGFPENFKPPLFRRKNCPAEIAGEA